MCRKNLKEVTQTRDDICALGAMLERNMTCPDCGSSLVASSGCDFCPDCGWSVCP